MNFLRLSAQDILSCAGKLRFFHNQGCNNSGAYEISEKCKINVFVPRRLGAKSLTLSIFNENKTEKKEIICAKWLDFSEGYDKYEISISPRTLGAGLYFGILKFDTIIGEVFAKRDGDLLVFSDKEPDNTFQLTVSDFLFEAPKEKYGGIIYHIFVDRFYRSGNIKPSSDVEMVEDWHSEIPEFPKYPGAFIKNNYFYGGNLYGIAEKLDYIASLGVNTIYLSPIFKALSNHKYDTGDYMQVDSMFGGDEALKHLIIEAKKLGIGIILDGVFNHTGSDSIYFNKLGNYNELGAYQSKESKYYEWYDFQVFPNKYTCWWGIDILPRINPDVESCGNFFVGDGGVIEKYAKMGIDGFRLDVADELSDEFIKKIKKKLNEEKKNSILYGEVWEDASNKIAYGKRKKYYLGQELDGVMNYPAREAIISFLKYNEITAMNHLLNSVIPNAPKRIRDAQMNLLGTHDTERILSILGGDSHDGKTNTELSHFTLTKQEYNTAVLRLKMAYTFISTLPGIPTIFYGDEAGLEGYSDPFNRKTYPWGRENSDILEFYRKIGKIRIENKVYQTGEFQVIYISPTLLIYKRFDENSNFITVINNSEKCFSITFSNKAFFNICGKECKEYVLNPFSAEIINAKSNSTMRFKYLY